jgi:hypothetical protein
MANLPDGKEDEDIATRLENIFTFSTTKPKNKKSSCAAG